MTHVPEEVLAAVALGELEVAAADLEHVRACPSCGAEVAQLRRVQLLLTQTPVEQAADRAPSGQVWERIAAATSAEGGAAVGPVAARPPTPLRAREPVRAPARWSRRWRLLAAAAICVLGGVGVGRLLWGPGQPAPQVISTVALSALDGSQTLGQADLLEQAGTTELRISTATMPTAPGYVEVWLLNDDGQRMLSLGVLETEKAVFAVPPSAVAQGYRIVDLSRERYDNDARHSGDSIMRGMLPA